MDNKLPAFVIDDDPTTAIWIEGVLAQANITSRLFGSAEQFLAETPAGTPGVLVVDLQLPGMSGIELIDRLNKTRWNLPSVVVTVSAEVSKAVRAIKAGALEYLPKPIEPEQLLAAVKSAFEIASVQDRERTQTRVLMERLGRLTPREREVFALIVSGLPNKLVAAHIGLAEKTVEIHRAATMKKMQAESFAHLVRMAVQLEQSHICLMPERCDPEAGAA